MSTASRVDVYYTEARSLRVYTEPRQSDTLFRLESCVYVVGSEQIVVVANTLY